MITEYHRPSTLESAIELLGRKTPETVPLAGGTLLNQKIGPIGSGSGYPGSVLEGNQ